MSTNACDHYSDRMRDDHDPHAERMCVFDGAGLAHTISRLRHEAGRSTRDVAAHAGISQAYVVALESACRPGRHGPTPTIEVIARLAHALGVHHHDLVDVALRQPGNHVLCVVDRPGIAAVAASLPLVDDRADWVWVGGRGARAARRSGTVLRHIDLGARHAERYDADAVAGALCREIAGLPAADDDAAVGLVFADSSAIMSAMPDPDTMLELEHDWGHIVARAGWSAGRQVAWNVCLYELDTIRTRDDPIDVVNSLARTHDEVWFAARSGVMHGSAAELEVMRRLGPHRPGRARVLAVQT